jgi:hypothetical protein
MPADSPAFWPLEADPSELQAYVTLRVVGPSDGAETDDVPVEPGWFRQAFDASWTFVLAEADWW